MSRSSLTERRTGCSVQGGPAPAPAPAAASRIGAVLMCQTCCFSLFDRQAGEREIKQAYRAMAKQFHPDKVAAEEREQAEAKFRWAGMIQRRTVGNCCCCCQLLAGLCL